MCSISSDEDDIPSFPSAEKAKVPGVSAVARAGGSKYKKVKAAYVHFVISAVFGY